MKFTNTKFATILLSMVFALAMFSGVALADEALDSFDSTLEEIVEQPTIDEIESDMPADDIAPVDSLDEEIIDDTVADEEIVEESDARTYNTVSLNVAYRTASDIVNFADSNPASSQDAVSYKTEQLTSAPYTLGAISDETAGRALNMLNQFRYIAGLDADVTLSSSYTKIAQAASAVNYANDSLSHSPSRPAGISSVVYAQGKSGASKSNLAYDYSLNSALLSYMDDSDSSNISELGHRRWILNPRMAQTGFGATGAYSAMYAVDKKNSSSASAVAWPAQEMPVEYFDADTAWSLSIGKSVNASDVKVTLTRNSDGYVWNFSKAGSDGYFTVNNGSYGQTGCVIFRPDGISINSGDSFNVVVAVGATAYTYNVNFFSMGSADAISGDTTPDQGGNETTDSDSDESDADELDNKLGAATLNVVNSSIAQIVTVDGAKIVRVNAGTTAAQLTAAFEGEVKLSSSKVVTGSEISLIVKGVKLDSAKVAVIGDATKDGAVTASDYAQVIKASRSNTSAAAEVKSAMDMNGDGRIDANDVAAAKALVFKK